MAKLTVQLKQHTPIIQFQHYQDGATLRASELKPKLDKFLIAKFKKEHIDYKKWLIGKGEHLALNYKVKIISLGKTTYYLPLPLKLENRKHPNRNSNLLNYLKEKYEHDVVILAPTSFFSNSDKIKFLKDDTIDKDKTEADKLLFALYTKDGVEISFDSWEDKIIQKLKSTVTSFFLSNNFGTRQDKGFGSYTVKNIDGKGANILEEELKHNFIKKSKNSNSDLNKLFDFILGEYQLLKSGKNKPYNKSELFKYFVGKKIKWDKRFIKKQLDLDRNKILNKALFWDKKPPIDYDDTTNLYYNEWGDRQTNNYKFIRALLGLAEHYEFDVFNSEHSGKDREKRYIVSLIHKPKPGKEKIERFPSPIFFKVINGYVYLGINDSYKDILGEKFEFHLKLKGDKKETEKNIGTLDVPDEFDLKDFINTHISNSWENL
jgi:hypothetical protein